MRETIRNYWRRVLEIIWKEGECLGHGNIIYWVLYLDGFWWAGPSSRQTELQGSKRSFIRSIACVTSPSLMGSHTYQTGLVNGLQLSDRSLAKVNAAIQHKGGDSLYPCSSLPTALMRLTAGFSPLAWEGTHPDKTCWLQAESAASLMVVNQCCSNHLSCHSGMNWVTLWQRFA